MADVVVLGAGVIGLTSALTLEERGHRVRVIAASTGASVTSSVAGAIWFPFWAEPRERVSRWASVTRHWLTDLSRSDASAGVDVLRMLELDDSDQTPWWGMEIEDLSLERAGSRGVDSARWNGAPFGWRFSAPRVDPRHHLPWLEARLRTPVLRRTVSSLSDVVDDRSLGADVVVNCTGLGAGRLARDEQIRPLFGQVVVCEPGTFDPGSSMADERDPKAVFYAIPRRDEVIIGGCTAEWDGNVADGTLPAPDPNLTEVLLARAARYGVEPRGILRVVAGLRPYRTAVRVERDAADPRIIHNYGHGGSGYTIARGCAEEVAGMVERGA
ncbi:MAG: FAD-binding oxidoreductase [Phycisphaeraceae bacterium]|nr:FAD-binding oxidoreductase [Phycisphaeraceae bacterium]